MKRPRLHRIGCIGDPHAEDRRLARAIDHLHGAGVDAILCVGDLVDGEGDVDRLVDLLKEHEVLTVRGNHDRWFLQGVNRGLAHATRSVRPATRDYLEALPATIRLPALGGDLLLCHGVGEDDTAELRPDTDGYALACLDRLPALESDPSLVWMVGGHTHQVMLRALPGLWVINAGALAGSAPGFVIVDLVERTLVHQRFADGDALAEPRRLAWPAAMDLRAQVRARETTVR
ncbi:MAG: metallophosphoesterase family protein [Nannocystaceae bacterium]